MQKITKATLCGSVTVIALASASGVQADTRGVLLFDKTGSMNVTRWDGESRCEFGKDLVIEKLGKYVRGFQGDYLDVRVFDGRNSMTSITGGYQKVSDLRGSALGQYIQNVRAELEATQCSGGTALGDALCFSADSLRAEDMGGDRLMMTVVTDAGENNSAVCGGANYVENKVEPKVLANPKIQFDISILNGGNVDAKASGRSFSFDSSEMQEFEKEFYSEALTSARKLSRQTSEITQLKNLAAKSGGTVEVISDNDFCDGECGPDGPW